MASESDRLVGRHRRVGRLAAIGLAVVVDLAVWAVGAGSASDPGWIRVLYRRR